MPKPSLIEDRSALLTAISLREPTMLTDGRIGALSIDGTTVSYSVEDGPPLLPMQTNDLLVAIEAISSRFPNPWHLPASVHLYREVGRSFSAFLSTQDADAATPSIALAQEAIANVADYAIQDRNRYVLHILVGSNVHHYSFHLASNPLLVDHQ